METIVVRRTDTIPEGAQVCHFDELDEPAQVRFERLVAKAGQRMCISSETVQDFCGCRIVKFTDYYQIGIE